MTHPQYDACDEQRLNRLMDGDLGVDEMARMEAHLARCGHCRRQAAAMAAVSQHLRDRVRQATAQVDFASLEKSVLNRARRRRHHSGVGRNWLTALKVGLPAAVTAGLLLVLAYTHFLGQPAPAPSAIINSFTGPMSSVMIFETPETRQVIIWYKEELQAEGDSNAV